MIPPSLLHNSGNRAITLMGSHLHFVDAVAQSHASHTFLTMTKRESQVSASSVLHLSCSTVLGSLHLSAFQSPIRQFIA